MSPIFSIIIPTRERHNTLKYTIKSVICQTYKNFDLVIMDNFSSPETAEVVASFEDTRIKYYRSPERLSMSDNWELGLSHASGEYIFILGDDDALMPDGIEIGLRLIKEYNVNIVSWNRSQYWWHNAVVPWLRSRLYLNLKHLAEICNSREKVKQFYEYQATYEQLPMIYNSFVHRDVIAKAKTVNAKYFMTPCPDVESGVVNAYFTEKYLYSYRSLSIAGISGHSTGTSTAYPSCGVKTLQEFIKEEKKDVTKQVSPRLVPTFNQEILIADLQIIIKEHWFPLEDKIDININNLLNLTAARINRDPNNYENSLKDIEALASKYKIPITSLNIPKKSSEETEPYQGFIANQDGSLTLVVNCEQAEILSVDRAAMLAQGILPKQEELKVHPKIDRQNDAAILPIELKEINLIMFPDWSEPEESLSRELQGIIGTLANRPDKSDITLVVDTTNISEDDANLILSSIAMNLLMESDLDVADGPEIFLLGKLDRIQWADILPRIHNRIVMEHENRPAIAQSGASSIPTTDLISHV